MLRVICLICSYEWLPLVLPITPMVGLYGPEIITVMFNKPLVNIYIYMYIISTRQTLSQKLLHIPRN